MSRFMQAVILFAAIGGSPACAQLWIEADSDRFLGLRSSGTLFHWEGSSGEMEPGSIATDRPDFTEASSTVGRGVTQIESGYTFFHDSEGDSSLSAHSFGEILLRQGIGADWLELRLGIAPVHERVAETGFADTNSGLEDLYVGLKLGLTTQEGWLPEMALVPQARVPTGSSPFTSNQFEPGVNWLYGWDITESLSTAGSTQVNRSLDDLGASYAEIAQSWTIGFGLTEELSAYTEWFAFFPTDSDAARQEQYFDGGLTYLFSDDVQLDVRAGVGLNAAATDFFTGIGLSIRFP